MVHFHSIFCWIQCAMHSKNRSTNYTCRSVSLALLRSDSMLMHAAWMNNVKLKIYISAEWTYCWVLKNADARNRPKCTTSNNLSKTRSTSSSSCFWDVKWCWFRLQCSLWFEELANLVGLSKQEWDKIEKHCEQPWERTGVSQSHWKASLQPLGKKRKG